MTESSEAAAAAEIFPSMSNERRLGCTADLMKRRKITELIITWCMAPLREENGRLKKQLSEAKEYLVGVQEKRRQSRPRQYPDLELDLLVEQLAEATNEGEGGDAH